MSYDLVFWRGAPRIPAAEVWAKLAAGAGADLGLERVPREELVAAFSAIFGARFDAAELAGPGFDVAAGAEGAYWQLSFSYSAVSSDRGKASLARARLAACDELGCHLFDPQTGAHRPPPPPVRLGSGSSGQGAQPFAELEREDDPVAWSVYADKLESVGDPRAQAIRLELERRPDWALQVEALKKRHSDLWVGPLLGELVRQNTLTIEYGYGHFRSAALRSLIPREADYLARALRQLLGHESARFLRTLVLGGWMDHDAEELSAELRARAPRSLWELRVEPYGEVSLGALSRAVEQLPSLRGLHVRATTLPWCPLRHGELTWLSLEVATLGAAELEALADSDLPKVANLTLQLGADASASLHFERLFSRLPSLRDLQLHGVVTGSVVAGLAANLGRRALNSVNLSELDERALAALDDAAFSGTHIWLSGDYAPEAVAPLASRFGDRFRLNGRVVGAAAPKPTPPAPEKPPMPPPLTRGAAVEHARFGAGVILELSGDKATVRFADGTERKLLASVLKRAPNA